MFWKMFGIDPEKYMGLAFGMGVERLGYALLWSGRFKIIF